MIRKSLVVLLVFLVSLFFTSVYAQGTLNNGESIVNEDEAVKLSKKFIEEYFKAQETLVMPKFDYVVKNNDTGLFATLLEYEIEYRKAQNDPYQNVKMEQFDVKKSEIVDNRLVLNIYAKVGFSYSDIITNTKLGDLYVFEFQNINNKLMIVKIDSEANDYAYFKSLISQKKKRKSANSDVVSEVTQELINDIPSEMKAMDKSIEEMKSNMKIAANLDAQREIKEQSMRQATTRATVNFVANDARHYGWFWGSWNENMIFKRAYPDCTNFISQCIWAGYGGASGYTGSYGSQATSEALRQRVAQNYRQTSTWMGRNYKSPYEPTTPAFVSVVDLWTYATGNKGNGPKAYGWNSMGHWSSLAGYTSKFLGGDVLQAYSPVDGRYTHSMIVVNQTGVNIADGPNNVLLSQHSYDVTNRKLSDVIKNYGGGKCKLRMLRFKATTF